MTRITKIDRLPPRIKAYLERILADRTRPSYKELSDWLAEQGYVISPVTIWRYDERRVQKIMERVRISTEAARLIAAAAPDAMDDQSAAALRIVQSGLFEVISDLAAADTDTDPETRGKILSQAARALADVARASISQKRWAEEVRAKLDAVEKAASKAGKRLDPETLKIIREGLYGG